MNILYHEMKKIWSPVLMIITGVFSVMFFLFFMEFNITHFPNGYPVTPLVEYAQEWTEKYGESLEAEERIDAEKKLDELYKEADEWIAKIDDFQGVGISNFEEYRVFAGKEEKSQEEWDIEWILLEERADYIAFRIEAYESLLKSYDEKKESMEIETRDLKNVTIERIQKLYAENEFRDIMPESLMSNLIAYIKYGVVCIIIGIFIMISPIVVRDRQSGIEKLQYSSRKGRKIIKNQFAAVLISAFLLTTAGIVIFGALYASLGTHVFWGNIINGFMTPEYFLFNWTYGTWILAAAALVYLMCLGSAALIFCISKLSDNYVAMLTKNILLLIVLIAAVRIIFSRPFGIHSQLYSKILTVPGVEWGAGFLILLCGAAWGTVQYLLEKKKSL